MCAQHCAHRRQRGTLEGEGDREGAVLLTDQDVRKCLQMLETFSSSGNKRLFPSPCYLDMFGAFVQAVVRNGNSSAASLADSLHRILAAL